MNRTSTSDRREATVHEMARTARIPTQRINSPDEWAGKASVMHEGITNPGRLLRLDAMRVAKVFPPKRRIDGWLRQLLARTKAHRQADAMQRVRALGLNAAEPLEILLFPPGHCFGEAALVYAYVDAVGTLRETLGRSDREALLDRLADELVLMANAGLLVSDLHLGNLLVDRTGKLTWIDLELKYGTRAVRAAFWSRVGRMFDRCDDDLLNDADRRRFSARVDAALEAPEGFAGRPAT